MATATLLPSKLQNSLQQIVEQTNRSSAGIRAILLSTAEGVPLGRVYASDQPLNEDVLASIESIWAPASKQFPVLGLDKLHQITAIYDHGTLIHVYQTPVVCCPRGSKGNKLVLRFLTRHVRLFCQVVTLLCNAQSNIGAIRSIAIPLLKQVLEPLCTTLENSLKPDWHDGPGTPYYQ